MDRDRRITEYITHGSEKTERLGFDLGKQALPNTVFCLFGDLGAGKTTLIKGIVEGAIEGQREEVCSPTFQYLNSYTSKDNKILYHFDLYRLKNVEEFLALGFEDYFFAGGITCIEWSEKIKNLLPETSIHLYLSYMGLESRKIRVSYHQ